MRILNSFIFAASMVIASLTTSASAYTIDLSYSTVADVDEASTVGALFDNGNNALVRLTLTGAVVRTDGTTNSGKDYTRYRFNDGSISLFNASNPSEAPMDLSPNGVDVRIFNGEVRFATRARKSVTAGDPYLNLGSNFNTVEATSITVGMGVYDLIVALGDLTSSDYGVDGLQIRANGTGVDNQTAFLNGSVLMTSAGLTDVSISNVPLPAGAWLLLGAVGIMALRRKRAG